MANNIKQIFDLLEYSQLEIAEKLSISKQTLYYNINTESPKKYNKQISEILGINEFYLTKENLSSLDLLQIQKEHLLNKEKNDNDAIFNLEQEIKEESILDEVKKMISSSELNLWFLEVLTKYLKKPDSIEFAILKKTFVAIESDKDISILGRYMPGHLTRMQRQDYLNIISDEIKKFNYINEANAND
ncbi:hypothetical protein LPY66_02800 [Dehalobacter sp. DCM]|uniref:hypothetical protein n=1 Tax=Dehalobacter sp. DCM TaxID=2907827 RepID=UPI003081B5A7|nr:hypothetical protein LPY66_02800 [Dehalobacter sp. DCM]